MASPLQSKTYGSSATSASHSVTFDAAPTTGNLLILGVVSDSTTSGTPSGWSVANSAVNATGTYLYYMVVTAGLSSTITVSLSVSDNCVLLAYEYSGNLAIPLDKTASAVAQSSPVGTGTTATTTQADELIFALVGLTNGNELAPAVSSWSNSFVQLSSVANTINTPIVRAATASLTVSSTGAYSTSASATNVTSSNSGIIASFKITVGPTIGSVPSGVALTTPAFTAKFLFFDTGDYGIGV